MKKFRSPYPSGAIDNQVWLFIVFAAIGFFFTLYHAASFLFKVLHHFNIN